MASACQRLSQLFCRVPQEFCTKQPHRTVVILKRMFPPRLYREDQTGPFRPKLKRSSYVYMFVDNTNWKPFGNMEVILATDVEGLGYKGDIVTVSKYLARNYMFPASVADYINPENLLKYEAMRNENTGKTRQTLTGHQTLKKLEGMTLPIGMSETVPWELNKNHVKVSFRKHGVTVTEDCILLPETPITGPTETTIQVKVNTVDVVSVKAVIYHYSKAVTPILPRLWSDSESNKFDIVEAVSSAAERLRKMKLTQ